MTKTLTPASAIARRARASGESEGISVVTARAAVAALLPGSESALSLVTVAVLLTGPYAVGRATTSVTVTESPERRTPALHVIVVVPVHEP